MRILITGTTRWLLRPSGDLYMIGMVRPMPYRITGAIQPRRWPRSPIRYSIAELVHHGHKLQWRDGDKQLIQVTQMFRKEEISWKYLHWME